METHENWLLFLFVVSGCFCFFDFHIFRVWDFLFLFVICFVASCYNPRIWLSAYRYLPPSVPRRRGEYKQNKGKTPSSSHSHDCTCLGRNTKQGAIRSRSLAVSWMIRQLIRCYKKWKKVVTSIEISSLLRCEDGRNKKRLGPWKYCRSEQKPVISSNDMIFTLFFT